MRLALVIACCAACSLGGKPPSYQYYVLTSRPASPAAPHVEPGAASRTLAVDEVKIPGYLDREQIATRTTLVSAATALSVIPLLFGGAVLLNFSIAILFGIVVGTFSSTYVAAMLLLYLPAVGGGGTADTKAEEATA